MEKESFEKTFNRSTYQTQFDKMLLKVNKQYLTYYPSLREKPRHYISAVEETVLYHIQI